MYCARFESSPALKRLKKLAGSERMRIIVAASVDTLSFVPIRAVSMVWTEPKSRALTVAQIRKAATPMSARGLPEVSTSEKSFLFSQGVSAPMPVTISMATASSATSAGVICCNMYFMRSLTVIFVSGKGL